MEQVAKRNSLCGMHGMSEEARTLVNQLKRNSGSRQGASRRRAVEEADEEEEQGNSGSGRKETAATPHLCREQLRCAALSKGERRSCTATA